MKKGLNPLGDRVLVRPIKRETQTQSGIILPETSKDRSVEGEVVAIGPGRVNDQNELIPTTLKPGARVFFPKFGGTDIKIAGEDYLILREGEILAVWGG